MNPHHHLRNRFRCHIAALTLASFTLAVAAGCAKSRTWYLLPADLRQQHDPVELTRRVADSVIASPPDPLKLGEPIGFNWYEGVLMTGMMKAGIGLKEPRYIDYVRAWADEWHARGIGPVLEGTRLKGYCGHWINGYACLLLYQQTRDPRHLALARQVADFIMTRAARLDNGGLDHWIGDGRLWVDTLYMACPLLADLSVIDGKPELLAEAVRQLDIYATHLQDADTGLFRHAYNQKTDAREGVFWGRGNGWVILSYADVLEHGERIPPEQRRRLVDQATRLAEGLLKTQDPKTGLWHTVLDRSDSYLETSASAMNVGGLAKLLCVQRLDADLAARIRAAVNRAWPALAGQIDPDGNVINVSGGTMPGPYEQYAQKPVGEYAYGTGAYLIATAELLAKEE